MGILSLNLILLLSLTTIKALNNIASLNPYVQETTEFRGVWVATVGNLNIGKQIGTTQTSINEWKNQYLEILDNAEKYHFNAIVFQIRPANDAFYPSKYNPWSDYMVGYGVNPGWDPLAWMIEVTHERGLEYHAWLNPYRASVNALSEAITIRDNATGINYVADYNEENINKYKEAYYSAYTKAAPGIENPALTTGSTLYHNVVLGTEGKFILNPAADETVDHLEKTVNEIIDNYQVDGIHFDDYFYPDDCFYSNQGTNSAYRGYSFSSESNVDFADYNNYKNKGGTLSVYDWRRENVNTLILSLSNIIREHNKTSRIKCAFGISPSARWAPSIESCPIGSSRGTEEGMNSGCNNYYSYSDLYADTYKWCKEGWIDYIIPQAYAQLDESYIEIVSWWSSHIADLPIKLYIGTPLYQMDKWGDSLEIYYQIRYNQSHEYSIDGYCIFSYSSILTGKGKSAINTVNKSLWKNNALTPLYENYTYNDHLTEDLKLPKITYISENNYELTFAKMDNAKAYEIYEVPLDTNNDPIFENATLALMALNPNLNYSLTTKDNCQYIYKVIDKTNLETTNYITLVLAGAPKNELPIISTNSVLNANYLENDLIEMSFMATDPESLPLTYEVWLTEDGGTDYYKISHGDVVDGSFTFSWQAYMAGISNAFFKVIVSDGVTKAEYYSTNFNVVDELPKTNHQPTILITSKVEDKYLVDDELSITYSINDEDNDEISYEVVLVKEGETDILLTSGKLNSPYNYTYVTKAKLNMTDGRIKVIINDGELSETCLSMVLKVEEAPTNVKPSITVTNDLITEYKVNDRIELTFTTLDQDNDQLTYKAWLKTTDKLQLITSGNVDNNQIIISYELTEALNDAKIIVTVSDGKEETEWESTTFTVTTTKKKGCKKKDIVLYQMLVSLFMIALIFTRKKK